MRVTFLLGPAGSGKTWRCLADIRAELLRSPDGLPLLLLAPKQATFQLERQLLASPELPGYARLEISSFERLASGILEHQASAPITLLDQEGRLMVLRALLARHHRDLHLYRATARLPGFAQQLEGALRELQEHGIPPDRLEQEAARTSDDSVLAGKLRDLAFLLRAYQDWLESHALQDSHRLLDLATAALGAEGAAGSTFRLAGLWLDGFAEMTPQELDLLAAVIPRAGQATLAFCLPAPPDPAEPRLAAWNLVSRTCRQLLARLDGLTDVRTECRLLPEPGQPTRFSSAPFMASLERRWTRPGAATTPVDPGSAFRLVICPDIEAETVVAAREILRHVRSGGRYRDCALLLRSFEGYHDPIARTLQRYGIPFFLDRREPVAHHPLAELTRYALRLAAFAWQTEDWIGALKTGLAPLGAHAVDELENAALAHGWNGRQWLDPLQISGDETLARRLEAWRKRVVPPFARFVARLAALEQRPLGAALAEAFGALWRDLAVEETLSRWARPDEGRRTSGPRFRPAVHETVWDELEAWRENLALAFPEETLALGDWLPIVEAGLATLTVGIIPPALDQVLVGTVDRSRNPELRLAVLLGMNEGRFPAPPSPTGLLTESERERLETRGLALTPDPLSQVGRERYLGYIACTRAADRLVWTLAERDAEGRVLNPSPFVAHLQRLWPGLVAETEPDPASDPLHPCEVLSTVLAHLAAKTPGAETAAASPAFESERNQLRLLAAYPPPAGLDAPLALALYGARLRTSVSSLERFAACPFQFFVRTGLRAEERQLFEVDPRERGTFQHEVLARFHEELAAAGLRWRDLTPAEARERVLRIAATLLKTHRDGLFDADASRRLTARQMASSIADFIEVAVAWMPACQFDPHRVELGFGGSGDPLPAWEIDLGNGCTLVFRGRIDRIDLAQEPGAPDVVRCLVIDYKSSARQLDAVLLAHGLQLQLPAYLSVLQALPVDCLVPGARRLVPGGAFFVNLKGDASGASNRHDVLDTLPSDRNASYQHRGCYRSDFLPQLDSGFPAARSGQFAWSVNKSGELSRRPSDPRAPAEFEAMLRTLAETLRAMGRRICDGDIRVDPHQHKGKTACDACEFQSICRIDSWTHAYRQLGEENLPASPP